MPLAREQRRFWLSLRPCAGYWHVWGVNAAGVYSKAKTIKIGTVHASAALKAAAPPGEKAVVGGNAAPKVQATPATPANPVIPTATSQNLDGTLTPVPGIGKT
jgi:hypothetical protein